MRDLKKPKSHAHHLQSTLPFALCDNSPAVEKREVGASTREISGVNSPQQEERSRRAAISFEE